MVKSSRYSLEVRERAVRLVVEHREKYPSEWAAICSIAGKFGCAPETLRGWLRRAERDARVRLGLSSDQVAEVRELRREVRELRRVNEILVGGVGVCRSGGARPSTEVMVAFVDEYREVRGRGGL